MTLHVDAEVDAAAQKVQELMLAKIAPGILEVITITIDMGLGEVRDKIVRRCMEKQHKRIEVAADMPGADRVAYTLCPECMEIIGLVTR